MNTAYFFGYGSLVNRATHAYADAHPARIPGWRRVWRHTAHHPTAFLTAIPDPETDIAGLIAGVPGGDWAALDQREAGYDRVQAEAVAHPVTREIDVQIYSIPHGKHPAPEAPQPILLSYLDVVVQGYLREFGEDGVRDFFATTDGWDAPILDDRATPRYPRAQALAPQETALVDDLLARYRRS